MFKYSMSKAEEGDAKLKVLFLYKVFLCLSHVFVMLTTDCITLIIKYKYKTNIKPIRNMCLCTNVTVGNVHIWLHKATQSFLFDASSSKCLKKSYERKSLQIFVFKNFFNKKSFKK